MRIAHPDSVEVAGAHLPNAHIALLGSLDSEHALYIILQLAAGAFHLAGQRRVGNDWEKLKEGAGVLTRVTLSDLLPGDLLLALLDLILLLNGIQFVHDALTQCLELICSQLPDIIVLGAVAREIVRPVLGVGTAAGIAWHTQGVAASLVG